MAFATSVPPLLALRRSAQSGSKDMTAAWQVVYTELSSSGIAYLAGPSNINLSTMEGGDLIDIRRRKVVVPDGEWVNHEEIPYNGDQPNLLDLIIMEAIPDVYGVEIAMRQTAGVLRSIECEFFVSKILGLS